MSKKITRVLHVRGHDYAACAVEDKIGINKVAKMVKDGVELPEEIEARILEFGPVDPAFIEFVYDLMDYDQMKSENFFVLD